MQHTKFGWNICLRSRVLRVQSYFSGITLQASSAPHGNDGTQVWWQSHKWLLSYALTCLLRLRRRLWSSLPNKRFWKCKIHPDTFVKLGLKIICAKFSKHWTKFGACKRFLHFSMKSKMAAASIRLLWNIIDVYAWNLTRHKEIKKLLY